MSKQDVSSFILVSLLVFAFVGVDFVPGTAGQIVCDPTINDPKCKDIGCWCIAAGVGKDRDSIGYCRNPKDVIKFC